MYIIQISSECAPAAKVGGLADVVQGLSYELAIRGHDVELVLPKYDCLRYDHVWGLTKSYADLWVPFHDVMIHCDVYFGFIHGVKAFFIEPHSDQHFFNRNCFYGCPDDAERFAFFSKAAMEFLLRSGKRPDIIHCHDWQTGLIPLMLFETYAGFGMTHPRTCYTIHNIQHQGITGEYILRQIGMNPAWYMTPDRCLDDHRHGAVNMMKTGIVFSNFVTTVSPQYMDEMMHTAHGHGLQGVIHAHAAKTGGVLNGVDYNQWNPEIDPYIAAHYTPDDMGGKYACKEALRNRLLLQDVFKPIVAVVSRLDHQKGVELIRHGIFHALAHGCQFVLLGASPDPDVNSDFWGLKHDLNDSPDCHLEIGYSEELARQIYAGAEMLLIPSAFEPCGLTQLIAMKYGTVPVVRATGGLVNTVFDADHAARPHEERNGYVFNDFNAQGLESALDRAIGMWYSYPDHFRGLALNGMKADFSWNRPAQDYLNIYRYIRP